MKKISIYILSVLVTAQLPFAQKHTHININVGKKNIDTATFATGCFWCTEAKFQQLNGVISVKSGYTGGHVTNPSYKDVCTGQTGHAEACNIIYDASKISYDKLLAAFLPPTTQHN